MKKVLFSVLFVIVSFSCSKEGDTEKSINEKILGKWHFESSADGGLITTTPASGCALLNYITYESDMTMKNEVGSLNQDNNCKVSVSMRKYKIYENLDAIYLVHSYLSQPTDKLETEIKYKIIDLSENKLKIQAISIGHYKLYNGVSVYVVEEYEPINKIIITYSR